MNDFNTDTSKEAFQDEKVNLLGVDIDTSGVKLLISKLNELDSIKSACDGGMYHEDKTISQVHVETTLTEDELDNWLYSKASYPREIEVYGTFERQ